MRPAWSLSAAPEHQQSPQWLRKQQQHIEQQQQYLCEKGQLIVAARWRGFVSLCIFPLLLLVLLLSAAVENVQSAAVEKRFEEAIESIQIAPLLEATANDVLVQYDAAHDVGDTHRNDEDNDITTLPQAPAAAIPPPDDAVDGEKKCVHTLRRPEGFWRRHFDFPFLKKFFKHWIPFVGSSRVRMHFYLYKRDFAECGREMRLDDDESLNESGFDANHPTRIIIHGWMSQSKGTFNRAVKNAYLSLTRSREEVREESSAGNTTTSSSGDTANNSNSTAITANSTTTAPPPSPPTPPRLSDVNVIVVDWSFVSSNVNYFSVVDLIEDLGFVLAELLRYLHHQRGLQYDDVYLIGHSLGAQIAGSAGKQLAPFRINTIYALDPAGPSFRERSDEYRLDASDALYVESIQTSSTLGFEQPLGHATFYPNFGRDQKKCYIYGCSHSRAHYYFAETITSDTGFWGVRCQRESEDVWTLTDADGQFRMGGEPSSPKSGTFYVETNARPPFAKGKRRGITEGAGGEGGGDLVVFEEGMKHLNNLNSMQ